MFARYLRKTGIGHLQFAAGDSEVDLPLLTRADRAAVVNPKQQLAAIALENSWEIIKT